MKKIHNRIKSVGAYVWHNGFLRRITNQHIDKDHVVIENQYKLKRRDAHLARIGDEVKYIDLSILPDRCTEYEKNPMYITSFYDNGNVTTNVDESGSGYGHLKSATGLPSTKSFRTLRDLE